MNESSQTTPVERAREAAGRGEWQQAYDLLIEVDASSPLSAPDLALLADMAYATGRFNVTIETLERAHSQSMGAGDQLAAAGAAIRIALHLLFDTALMAPVRGWIKRTERLLEGYDRTPVHAWLAVVRSYERLLSGDFESAQQWAQHGIDVGTTCNPAAAAIGRLAEARSLILTGNVSQGLELLNEAAVATVSGELDPLSTGVLYCELVCALQGLAQYDLAEEWTIAMEQWRGELPIGSVHGRCRVHRAEILRLRGSFLEAEKEALTACEELRPYLRREFGWPLTELGRIRLRRGDIQGAEEAFIAAHEVGWNPQPGLALVHLAKGDVTLAAASIRDALENPSNVPSKELPPNTELCRAPLLEAQVDVAIAAGDLDLAQAAAEELSHISAMFESKALSAGASLAHGRVGLAKGDLGSARQNFEAAVHLWSEVGAPYETALARMGLAHAHRAEGSEQRAVLEFRAAQAGFAQVGAMQETAAVARAWGSAGTSEVSKHDRQLQADAATGSRAAAENVFHREGDYWSVTFEGRIVRLHDRKGLRYLARLLAAPGREFHVLDLVAGERVSSGSASHSAERDQALSLNLDAGLVLLDAQAKKAYRRRLVEIEEDIEEARAIGNVAQAAQAETERDFLVHELARAVGLGGRDRRMNSASERARASVTRAVRQAIARIRKYDPALKEHLDRTIHTGTYCAYLPDPRVPTRWRN